MKNIRQISYF